MLDMKDFSYVEGNAVEFEGHFGKIKLIYRATHKEPEPWEGERVVPSHFDAFLTPNGHEEPQTIAEGITEESAVENVYKKYAIYRALEDLGGLENNPQNQ